MSSAAQHSTQGSRTEARRSQRAGKRRQVGFACAYTPLALIHAAGFEPYRILPVGDAPDQAGTTLHDNLCPHVKRILDRALASDLPELAGVVLVNSCDAMRRLADAWRSVRPQDALCLLDLPVELNERSLRLFQAELERLRAALAAWASRPVEDHQVVDSAMRYDQLTAGLQRLAQRTAALPDGAAILQQAHVASVTTSLEASLERLEQLAADGDGTPQASGAGVPIYLFGNVLPDPQALALFGACGCRLVVEDLCTGSRQLAPLGLDQPTRALEQLARALLARPPCARTIRCSTPGSLAEDVLERATRVGARGVVAHVMKFCDPYLARLPTLRQVLREAGLGLLVLEGDCSLRSLGQQRTRVEAFVEMLGG